MHLYSAVNVCTCHNGSPKVGVGCPATGAEKCASCNHGFTISHDGTKCIRTCVGLDVCVYVCYANMQACSIDVHICVLLDSIGNTCVCKNGVGQTGAGCPAIGAEKCASCDAGFTINRERTKCIRTCAWLCVVCMQAATMAGGMCAE